MKMCIQVGTSYPTHCMHMKGRCERIFLDQLNESIPFLELYWVNQQQAM
jgi:hypothetical protein